MVSATYLLSRGAANHLRDRDSGLHVRQITRTGEEGIAHHIADSPPQTAPYLLRCSPVPLLVLQAPIERSSASLPSTLYFDVEVSAVRNTSGSQRVEGHMEPAATLLLL